MKHESWTTSPGSGGKKTWVAVRLKNGKAGNGLVELNSEAEALEYIDSGKADELALRLKKMERKRR